MVKPAGTKIAVTRTYELNKWQYYTNEIQRTSNTQYVNTNN